jgi:hypothetical protein
VQLLSYFSSQFHKLRDSTLESDIPQLNEIPKQVNLKCDVETTSLNKHIEDLQGLQLQISALEGDIVNTTGNVSQREASAASNINNAY